MDEEIDEVSIEDNSEDDYDQEQLEIALYSQIHFEQDDAIQCMKDEDGTVDNDFTISVEGNEKTGFVAVESNADIILNDDLEKKYRNNKNILNDSAKRNASASCEKTAGRKSDTTSYSRSSFKNSSKTSFNDKFTSDDHEKGTKMSTKIKVLREKISENGGKKLTAEELFLGLNSEEDDDESDAKSDSDDEIICLSDSSDIVLADSDADSLDIVLGEPEEEMDDIQMNVRSNPRYTYRKMSHEEAIHDTEKHSDDETNWAICREDSYRDLMTAKSRPGRYYKPIKCHNCDKDGHLSKNCPQPKKVTVCIMCAEPGHISRTCPQSMCFNCNEPGHDLKSCTSPRRSLNYTCYRCNMKGHDQNRCPDNWRQFHVTVNPGKIQPLAVQTKRKTPSCFNCGEEGHFGHECEEDRMTRFTTVCTPFISRYQTMKEFSYKMRSRDEVEDRPLKRSRSDGWISNLVSSTNRSKPNHHITFGEEGANMGDVPSHSDNLIQAKRKASQFAHIVRKRPDNRTGRNNFDNMQFTLLNTGKGDTGKKTEASRGTDEKNWSKRRRGGREKTEGDFRKMENKSKSLTGYKRGKITKEEHTKEKDLREGDKANIMSNERDKERKYWNNDRKEAKFSETNYENKFKDKMNYRNSNNSKKESEKQFNYDNSSNVRKVTLNSSNCDFTISSNNNFNENNASGVKNNTDASTKGGVKHSNEGRRKRKRRNGSELDTVVVDLTIGNDNDRKTHKDKKWEETHGKFSNLRNDGLRSDDLFSLQKIAKLQSSGQFDMPNELEVDIEHQVHSNEWWRKNNSKTRRRKRNKRNKQMFD